MRLALLLVAALAGVAAGLAGAAAGAAVAAAGEAAVLDDDALLTRERMFSAVASHQLRTPLTQVRLLLEAGLVGDPAGLRHAAEEAVAATDRLEQTIEELLVIARPGPNGRRPMNVRELLEAVHGERSGLLRAGGRALDLVVGEDLPAVSASAAGVRQILGVLLDNATEHGNGTITVRARNAGHALVLDVQDEGPGPVEPSSGRGLGLPLAQALAEADGGRLARTGPATFTLFLPRCDANQPGIDASAAPEASFPG